MPENSGYWGKALFVDLTCEKVEIKDLSDEFMKKYLGGQDLPRNIFMTWLRGWSCPSTEFLF